jgi:hypothetical protein
MEHSRTENVASVVSLDFEVRLDFNDLVQIDRGNFLHAFFDHQRREDVLVTSVLHGHLPHVLLETGSNRIKKIIKHRLKILMQGRNRR